MKHKILIVEDDPTSSKLVEFLLKTNDFLPLTAFDGQEGLEKASQEKPDLVILDIIMPGMDGYTFLRELKSRMGMDTPPVIMLTSRDQMQDIFKMEGVVDYFVKPLETEKFLMKVRECLKGESG